MREFVMTTQIGGLHHVGLIVRDMEEALELYTRLGFRLPPPAYPMLPLRAGEPPKPFGVANTHVTFADNFVELVTIVDDRHPPRGARFVSLPIPPEVLPRVRETVQRTVATLSASFVRFQGLHILVFQTLDAEATGEQLSAAGVRHSGVNTVQREIDTPDGVRMVPVRVVELDGERVPEGRLAVAEDPPRVLDAQLQVDHPNGARALLEVVLCVADTGLDEAERRYAQYLARPVRREGVARVFDLGGSKVTLIPNSGLADILPGELAPALPAFVAYAVAVRDLNATQAWLLEHELPVMTTPAGDLFVPATAALGAAVIFRA